MRKAITYRCSFLNNPLGGGAMLTNTHESPQIHLVSACAN